VKNEIRQRREGLGWTQADLARELNISRQTVNALEAGRWDPSLPLAFAIAELFGEAIEVIFEPEDARRRNASTR
jgi:putative transcriptional regulator